MVLAICGAMAIAAIGIIVLVVTTHNHQRTDPAVAASFTAEPPEANTDVGTAAEPPASPFLAARAGNVGQLQEFIADGWDVDSRSDDSQAHTALHLAAIEGHADVVSVLVKAGANVNSRDGSQATPLVRAVLSGQIDVVNVLLQRGADVGLRLLTPVQLKKLSTYDRYLLV